MSWPLLFLLPLSHSPTSHWAGGRKTCSFGQLESLEWSAFLVVLSSLAEVSSSSFQCPHETFRPQDATHSKPQRWLPYALSYDFPSGSCWENPSYTGLCQKKKKHGGLDLLAKMTQMRTLQGQKCFFRQKSGCSFQRRISYSTLNHPSESSFFPISHTFLISQRTSVISYCNLAFELDLWKN